MLNALALTALLLTRLDSPVTDRAEALSKEVLKQGNDPRGAAPLIRLHGLIDDLDDLNLLAEPYSALIYRRNTDPHVRALARLFLADVERARGRTQKATEQINELGFIQDFHVVGAFDNEGKGGCDTDFGPETALDLKATYPAKAREVGWRKPHAKSIDGFVDLSLALKPNTEAVAYALTWLNSDQETRVVLSLGISGGTRVFLNGQKILSSDRYNLPRVDQHQVQVSLRKGMNRLLITAFAFALANDYDVLVTMDCDGQHEPSRIPVLLEALHACDIVSASRYLRDFRQDTPAPTDRFAINRTVTREINERYGLNITDAFCGFKAYRREALAKLRITETGWGMPLQLWVQAVRLDLRIAEIGVPRIYLDPKRAFGGMLNDAEARLAYYRRVLASAENDSLPEVGQAVAEYASPPCEMAWFGERCR